MRRLAPLLIIVMASSCARAPREVVLSGPTMGAMYTVRAALPDEIDAERLRASVQDALAQVDRQMSTYRADSELARFNASRSQDWIAVSPDLAAVVDLALQVSRDSGGAFDVTVAPLVAAWGFGPTPAAAAPSDAQLAELKARIGFERLQVRRDPPALRKLHSELHIDLNGVAPGFAVDLLAERLRDAGVKHYLIEIGGEVRAQGRSTRGRPWRVAVERPFDEAPAPYAIVQLEDSAVATSGEYRQSRLHDGRRVSHTIDPRAGRPVAHSLASVVVSAPSAALADAWATAYNVLGSDAGYVLATQLGMPVMFIDADGGQLLPRMTASFRPLVVELAGANAQP